MKSRTSQVASPDNSGSLIRLGTAAGHLSPVGSGGVGLVGSSRRHHSGGAGSGGQSELGNFSGVRSEFDLMCTVSLRVK